MPTFPSQPENQVVLFRDLASLPDFNLFATKEWVQEEDYTINGEITYTQRPNIDGSKAATLADLSGIPSYPDISDNGAGLVIIRKPNGTAAELLMNASATPDKYVSINGDGNMSVSGGIINFYKVI